MFDKIRFEELTLPGIAHKQGRKPRTSIEKEFKSNQNEFTDYYDNFDNKVAFKTDGRAQVLPPSPVSDYARQNLLYVHVFAIYDAGESFFTSRESFPFYLILYTCEGEGLLEYEGHTYTLPAGYGFLIDCRKKHTYRSSTKEWKHLLLHFSGHSSDWLYEQYITSGNPVFHSPMGGSFFKNLEQLLLCYQSSGSCREYELSVLLGELLLDLIKRKEIDSGNAPDYILYLKYYLENNFTRQMSLDEISKFASVTKFHLDREFKKYTGYSITNYLIELRLSRACFLLSSTPLSIREISRISGFSEYNNFLKLFKARYGITPSKYFGR